MEGSKIAPGCRLHEVSMSRGYVCWDCRLQGELGRAKLIRIARIHIDDLSPGSTGANESAWRLIWIDRGNVRRLDIMLDPLFGRLKDGMSEIPVDFFDDAPAAARTIIGRLAGRDSTTK